MPWLFLLAQDVICLLASLAYSVGLEGASQKRNACKVKRDRENVSKRDPSRGPVVSWNASVE